MFCCLNCSMVSGDAVGAAGQEKPARGGTRSLQQISHLLIQEVNFHHNDQSAKSAYIPFFCPIFPEQEDFKPGCLQVSHTSFVFFFFFLNFFENQI